jgi:hypothetical protein
MGFDVVDCNFAGLNVGITVGLLVDGVDGSAVSSE